MVVTLMMAMPVFLCQRTCGQSAWPIDELYTYLDRLIGDELLRGKMGEVGNKYASLYSTKEQGEKFKTFVVKLL